MTTIAEEELLTYTSKKRVSLANGGVTVDVGGGEKYISVFCSTDVAARMDLANLLSLATQRTGFTAKWINGENIIILDSEQIIMLVNMVNTFIGDTWGTRAHVVKEIMDGSITTISQIDAAPWPSTTPPQFLDENPWNP